MSAFDAADLRKMGFDMAWDVDPDLFRKSRCSWCGRTGTLTSLSAGNRCEMQDDCDQARQELIARSAATDVSGRGPNA